MTISLAAAALLVAMQVIGLSSVVVARASEGGIAQRLGHSVFWLCLAAMGTATIAATMHGGWLWTLCGLTLGTMVVGATFEPRPRTVNSF